MDVIKYNGEVADSLKCKKINGKLYEKNKDCFVVDDAWRRIDDPAFMYDIDNNTLLRIGNPFTIIGDSNNVIIRKLTSDVVLLDKSNGIPYEIEEILINQSIARIKSSEVPKGYVQHPHNGIFCKSPDRFDSINDYTGMFYLKNIYSFDVIKNLFNKDKIYNRGQEKKLAYTFGMEIETSSGVIPISKLKSLGIFPLRDGSISGFEYTTMPMESIEHAVEIAETVSEYCGISTNDSFHLHVGGIKRTKESIVKIYDLLYNIQNEVYSMFPYYKRFPKDFKRQNYTAKLPNLKRDNIDDYFYEIVNMVSNRRKTEYDEDKDIGMFGSTRKWEISSRYKIFNLVPFMYYSSGTIESRIHEETTNKYKIAYWILINQAIFGFAESINYSGVPMDKVSLSKIIKSYYGSGSKTELALNDYISSRKLLFTKDNNTKEFYNQLDEKDKEFVPNIKLF